MAYTIGSEKGKEIAKNMTVGSTYKASDGSTWTKKSDGSVSVTHQGVTTNNAYKPTSSSTSGGSSGGSSSGGGSSSKSNSNKNTVNSQYTSGKWDANTDYQAIIDDPNTDYLTKAKAEYLRNLKINGTGSNYATTNRFSGWLDETDYKTLGTQQMADGASAEDILNTIQGRFNKAYATEGLQQYADDEFQRAMWAYYENALKKEAAEAGKLYEENFEYDEQAPTYQGQYDPAITEMLNKILNRDDFAYDAKNDPLYQQYAALYQQEGDRAMRDTMAEAAASAGGMNSYAVTAAQQANNYYNSQLNNKIPELYQLAYEMYLQDKESMVQDLGLLQNMDAMQYNRYRDTMSDYYNDKNFAYGMYRDAVNQGNWQQEFNYNQAINDRNYNYQVGRDTISDNRYANEWNYGVSQDNYAKEQDEYAKKLEKAQTLAAYGIFDGFKELGYTDDEIKKMEVEYAAQMAASAKQSSSGGTPKPVLTLEQVNEEILAGNLTPGVLAAYEYYHKQPYKIPTSEEPAYEISDESSSGRTELFNTRKKAGAMAASGKSGAEIEAYLESMGNKLSKDDKDNIIKYLDEAYPGWDE